MVYDYFSKKNYLIQNNLGKLGYTNDKTFYQRGDFGYLGIWQQWGFFGTFKKLRFFVFYKRSFFIYFWR